MDARQQVRCPRCNNRLCDRTPSGLAAGHYVCRCKLEVIFECTALSEITLIVVPPELRAMLACSIVRQLSDGRGLVTWEMYKASAEGDRDKRPTPPSA